MGEKLKTSWLPTQNAKRIIQVGRNTKNYQQDVKLYCNSESCMLQCKHSWYFR